MKNRRGSKQLPENELGMLNTLPNRQLFSYPRRAKLDLRQSYAQVYLALNRIWGGELILSNQSRESERCSCSVSFRAVRWILQIGRGPWRRRRGAVIASSASGDYIVNCCFIFCFLLFIMTVFLGLDSLVSHVACTTLLLDTRFYLKTRQLRNQGAYRERRLSQIRDMPCILCAEIPSCMQLVQ